MVPDQLKMCKVNGMFISYTCCRSIFAVRSEVMLFVVSVSFFCFSALLLEAFAFDKNLAHSMRFQ